MVAGNLFLKFPNIGDYTNSAISQETQLTVIAYAKLSSGDMISIDYTGTHSISNSEYNQQYCKCHSGCLVKSSRSSKLNPYLNTLLGTCVCAFSLDAAKTFTDSIKLSIDPEKYNPESDPDNKNPKTSKEVRFIQRTDSDKESEIDLEGAKNLSLRPQNNGAFKTSRLDPGYCYCTVLQPAAACISMRHEALQESKCPTLTTTWILPLLILSMAMTMTDPFAPDEDTTKEGSFIQQELLSLRASTREEPQRNPGPTTDAEAPLVTLGSSNGNIVDTPQARMDKTIQMNSVATELQQGPSKD